VLSREQTVERASAHLRAHGSPLVASPATTTRNRRFGVWVVGYRDAARSGEPFDGGALVVTDDGDVHDLGSAPGSLDHLMVALGLWPGASPSDDVPCTDTDSEALALLADVDPAEAEGLTALASWQRLRREQSSTLDEW
jgi:hypothetical protein